MSTTEPPVVKGAREPKGSNLLQQSLPACKPLMEPLWVVFIFMAAAVLLVPIGAVCTAYSLRSVEVSRQYDDGCWPSLTDNDQRQQYQWQNAADDTKLTCSSPVQLPIAEDMNAPVYMFYEIDNMFQNHRRYVSSRSTLQLVNMSNPDTGQCAPQEYYNGTSNLIDPCGLSAWTFFNDTYKLFITRPGVPSSRPIQVSNHGIADPLDVDFLFANYTPSYFNPIINSLRGGNNITEGVQSDERFVNWMRLAALPRFRKLWAVINTDLKQGDIITVNVVNRYNTYAFGGTKNIVLATANWLGVRNVFLGVSYLVTGGLGAMLALVYGISVAVCGYHRGAAQDQLRAMGYLQ